MKLSYEYGTEKIEFDVFFRKRKTLTIEVEAPRKITVIAPEGSTEKEILETVQMKSKWIVQKLFEIREIEYRKRNKQYVNGESFLYMGRNYSLQIHINENATLPEAKLSKGKLCVTTYSNNEEVVKKAIEDWYKDKAKERIKERVAYYQSQFNVGPKRVMIKDQQKRWGSCTKDQQLFFNWKCIMAPSPVLDYIVVHEMSHMIHKNHSKEFWSLLKRILPEYEQWKEWLKNNGIRYNL